METGEACGEPDGVPLVVRVAKIVDGPLPTVASGQPRSPDFAEITCSTYLLGEPRQRVSYSLHLYFDEGLPVLREQYWGSRGSMEEVLTAAEACGVPRSDWTSTSELAEASAELPMAIQPSDGPRLLASRTYDLAAWPRSDGPDGRPPAEWFKKLLDEEPDGSTGPVPQVAAFLKEVLQAYPHVPGAASEATPWYTNPAWFARRRLALLELQFAAVPVLLPWLTVTALKHGLHLYNPQADVLYA